MRGVFAVFLLAVLVLTFTGMMITGLYALGIIGPTD